MEHLLDLLLALLACLGYFPYMLASYTFSCLKMDLDKIMGISFESAIEVTGILVLAAMVVGGFWTQSVWFLLLPVICLIGSYLLYKFT